MPCLGIARSFADFAADIAQRKRSNAPTKLYHRSIGFVCVAERWRLLPALGRSGINRSISLFSGAAAGARMLSQDGKIPITGGSNTSGLGRDGEVGIVGRNGTSGLGRIRSIFAFPAAALLIGLSVLLPGLSIPASADAATVKGAVSKSVKHAVKSDEIPLHCPAQFITALLIGPRGGLWAAGEDTGIYHRKAGAIRGNILINPIHRGWSAIAFIPFAWIIRAGSGPAPAAMGCACLIARNGNTMACLPARWAAMSWRYPVIRSMAPFSSAPRTA